LSHTGVILFNSDFSDKPIYKAEILCDQKNSSNAYMGCRLEIKIYFKTEISLDSPLLGIIIKDSQGIPMIGVNNRHYVGNLTSNAVSEGSISMIIPYLPFFEGIYHVDIHFGNAFVDIEVLRDCFQFTVEPAKFTSTGEMPDKKINRLFINDIAWQLDAK
jgi:hypothetical protein